MGCRQHERAVEAVDARREEEQAVVDDGVRADGRGAPGLEEREHVPFGLGGGAGLGVVERADEVLVAARTSIGEGALARARSASGRGRGTR